MASRPPPNVVPRPAARTRLPAYARLPLLIFLNLALRTALWTAVDNVLGHELGAVSKQPENRDDLSDLREPLGRLATTIALVSVAWQLRYDYFDIGALTAVINIPFAFLLTTYYNITHLTAIAQVANEVIAIVLPTYLLRPIADVNNPSVSIRNRYLLNSFQVSSSNILLALFVYATVLFTALQTNRLTLFLITHFDLPTVELAHDVGIVPLAGKLLLAAAATKAFLLNPSIGAAPDSGAATPVKTFEPATATLPQTLKHNLWFFSRRTRTLVQRTSVLSLFLLANTISKDATLEGTDLVGSVGYSSVWIAAAAICAGWYVWTGDAEP
ncbi:hypothetical protein N0V90_000248 [Kalmusia sp. IMI 367209]|nr:hypothetical protein N0V90_000248 [Kalmusia sp. IMI 367209]